MPAGALPLPAVAANEVFTGSDGLHLHVRMTANRGA